MLLGRVVGTLVSTNKEPSLEGLKFLVLRQLDIEGGEASGYRVAADAVGAGLGEVADAFGGGDVSGDDIDFVVLAEGLDGFDDGVGVTVGGVDDDDIDTRSLLERADVLALLPDDAALQIAALGQLEVAHRALGAEMELDLLSRAAPHLHRLAGMREKG